MKKIFSILSFICFSAPVFAFALNPEFVSDEGFPNNLKGKDFFLHRRLNRHLENQDHLFQQTLPIVNLQQCRDKISKIICLVDPAEKNEDLTLRKCQQGSQDYTIHFEKLFDHYPAAFQKMFCSLTGIFIEKKFDGTAYAGRNMDHNGNPTGGAFIGIRKSVLDENLNLRTWASWKEQLSFGGILDSYTLSKNLPHIATHSNTEVSDFLYFVIAHEFGHNFDFANKLNTMKNCDQAKDEDAECEMSEKSWGAISWITNIKPKPANDFTNIKGLCFYWCKENALKFTDVPQVYSDLAKTNFISLYATTQPWDDFADSIAYYLVSQNLNTSYTIDTRQENSYDIMAKLHSPLFAEKYQYIENFLNRTDIQYP